LCQSALRVAFTRFNSVMAPDQLDFAISARASPSVSRDAAGAGAGSVSAAWAGAASAAAQASKVSADESDLGIEHLPE
jgi:hypothetical protein